ncbi:uncharacterized protein Z518_00967 [Rhinocladiella mackenziei CBS 650.93]|uniref:Hypercellular protein HypA n=1 Tax=Rhinocladiella mackenziei CBS 650.93 TaxID=1442369 RepID=A0A0D2J2G1_9EURO|nr:uncharacterized protein Z518_00967 [Rhinocladiella mackenziei CBS 650.93]KIX09886.1 hypothetical protein Z518_00967 [Rhinocladiella mackenziei CBS 650.93]
MGYNPFLPTAGAKVNVQCVPAGPVTPDRFQKFIKLLQNCAIVKLKLVEFSLSPQGTSAESASEDGWIFYDISANQETARPHLFPFETNSRCQILFGIIDGERIGPDAASVLQSINIEFPQLIPSTPGLLVRQLICFSKTPSLRADSGIVFIPDTNGDNAARDFMITVSKQLADGINRVIDDFRDQPISMVPGAGSQILRRNGNTPNSAEGTSTPVSAKSQSPLPSNEAEAQSDTSRGRFNIIQGMFHLQRGLWSEALSSLSEGATIAQSGHDHLWHGKALECLLVCMLYLSWSEVWFAVPPVCRSLPNRSGSFQAEVAPNSGDSRKLLAQLMPPMVETVLELYAKVSNLDLGGPLQDVLRESRIRLVNLLVFVKRDGGVLNQQYLDRLVLGKGDIVDTQKPLGGEQVAISKAGLANILIETLQASQSSNNPSHQTSLLVAVASSLSTLGLDRKHAFYMKQLMRQLAPKLIEARKVGASEVGIHPAAGLPPITPAHQGIIPEMMVGTRIMLALAAAAYGAPLPPIPRVRERIPADLNEINENLRIWAYEHSSGDALLKLEMLRTCVSVCEALPDISAGLHLTSHILRGAKQVVTMPKPPATIVPLISAEEQARLVDSIKRAVSAASRMGEGGCRAEYWDDFLVRDVQVFERDTLAKLIPHKPSDLSVRSSGLVETVRDPFIYNPFSKDESAIADPVLVAGEWATFAVLLQNPLEVEVEIDEIRLITKDCSFTPSPHSIVLGPFSTQMFSLNGTPTESGDLQVVGCRARIRNCYEQDFLIFREDWKFPLVLKQNTLGRVRFQKGQPGNAEENPKLPELPFPPPNPSPLKLKVISAQPRLVIEPKTLGKSAIMLLEGESRVFELRLANESMTVAADFVLVTTEDSVTARLQYALLNKDLNPAELYEIQKQLAVNPAIEIRSSDRSVSTRILEPGRGVDYTVSIFGRPGLVDATVQADYAYLGSPSSEVKGTFYTRQVRFPIAVTVNGSVEIPRCNVLPIHSDFVWNSDRLNGAPKVENLVESRSADFSKLSRWLKTRPEATAYCMLTLDLRNVWPQPLRVDIQVRNRDPSPDSENQSWTDACSVHEILQPGHVSRVVLPVPRLFIKDPHAPIPNLETQKQFVVTSSKLSTEAEAASRESFWYREELLKCLRGSWKEESSGRHGEIDLRKGIRLSPRMVDVLKLDHIDIEYGLKSYSNPPIDNDSDTTVKQIGRSHFFLQTETFATLLVMIHNHTPDTLQLLLRLQPALRHQTHNIALDLSKRFAWSGVLQRALHPPIEPGGTYVAELGIIALAQGDYEINASVEEIKGRRTHIAANAANAVGTGTARRIWHARSACLIDAGEE